MNLFDRESRTKNIMIRMYCRANHHTVSGLCPECQELAEYSDERLAKCPFGTNKPACSRCMVNCYNVIHRRQIREVMRFAGPRMAWRHPILGIRYLITLKNSKKVNGH